MKKRLIVLVMICSILLSAIPISANDTMSAQIEPRWTNTQSMQTYLSFPNSDGTVTVTIDGYPGVSNITVEIKLYYKNSRDNWIDTHNSWTYSVDQQYFSTVEHFTPVAGRTYKAVMTATIYKDGYGEVITDSATATCPSN